MNFLDQLSLDTTDHFFINTAYLSELWAARDIETKLRQGLISGESAQSQIEDEYRHAEVLKKTMLHLGFQPFDDFNFSMQNILFRSVGGLDLSDSANSKNYFWGIHEVMERRAILNYKSYLLGGKIKEYKKILKIIIKEEKGHFKKIDLTLDRTKKVVAVDHFLHRKHLYKHYNKMNLLSSVDFWKHYFTDSVIKTAENPW